jgi:hypothetical protein
VVVEGATADTHVHRRCSSAGPRRLTSNLRRLGFGKLLDRKAMRGMDAGTPDLACQWCRIKGATTHVRRVIRRGRGRGAGLSHRRERGEDEEKPRSEVVGGDIEK